MPNVTAHLPDGCAVSFLEESSVKNQYPSAIMGRVYKLWICTALVGLVGFIWGAIAHDIVALSLTMAVIVAGGLKGISIYHMVKGDHYDALEGVVTSAKIVPLRHRTVITLADESGNERQLVLEGRHSFQAGERYRIYLQPAVSGFDNLPTVIKPAWALLGYERMS